MHSVLSIVSLFPSCPFSFCHCICLSFRGSTASNCLVGIFKCFWYSSYALWHLTTSLTRWTSSYDIWLLDFSSHHETHLKSFLTPSHGQGFISIRDFYPLSISMVVTIELTNCYHWPLTHKTELWSNMTVIYRVKTTHLRLTIIVIIPYIFFYIV
jgi:hypothetical protein